jgi:predicted transcriptional regulator of viral defense system
METKLMKALAYLKEHTAISAAQAKEIGVSRHELKLWADRGVIHRLARGYYGVEVLSASPEQVITLIGQPCAMAGLSALAHYGYTNYVVNKVWVLIPDDSPVINRPDVHTMRQVPKVFKLGLADLETSWGNIKITDREKSVIDGLRGTYLDLEEKLRVFKRWLQDPNHDRAKFLKYSGQIKISRKYIDWLLVLEAQT